MIADEAYALTKLKQIGYFALIGGYKAPFRNPTARKYRDGTTFEEIVALYEFDETLRALFLQYILHIEKNLRSLLSYFFTEKYGESQEAYLTAENFADVPFWREGIEELLGKLDVLAKQNTDYAYINYQREQYRNVPLWALVQALPFGALSHFYKFLTDDLRTKVAKNFPHVNRRQLRQFLVVVNQYRNVCAHSERLFSHRTSKDIPDMPMHVNLGIQTDGAQYVCGKHDLFALVIAFRYLLSAEACDAFAEQLQSVLATYLASPLAVTETELYCCMGFPTNWRDVFDCGKT